MLLPSLGRRRHGVPARGSPHASRELAPEPSSPPASPASRLLGRRGTIPILTKLKEFLDANQVAYEVRSHERAFTAQGVAAVQHVPGREVVKVTKEAGL
jgi:hypothetical protein